MCDKHFLKRVRIGCETLKECKRILPFNTPPPPPKTQGLLTIPEPTATQRRAPYYAV